jgi:hypothetical protein
MVYFKTFLWMGKKSSAYSTNSAAEFRNRYSQTQINSLFAVMIAVITIDSVYLYIHYYILYYYIHFSLTLIILFSIIAFCVMNEIRDSEF